MVTSQQLEAGIQAGVVGSDMHVSVLELATTLHDVRSFTNMKKAPNRDSPG